ncbi:MBL fold metallo-hydrolase RNA specificity domain-containing protein [Shewanella sp. NIFS-20-20]|uniref:MBL fold metallo-hydrolase RNA specificity domain-containing protein n=1 Tax=Shewanella sp. NIFS-20-20 TaxID=2853806 RepID=UPI001C484899|nr:MBL fold metallo-hydrolase [Shewanella sp. NIFS-20-20]MBV7314843.1 MBL fold metallo-hydrolase [Shewanella sp. NIFS-20-20]
MQIIHHGAVNGVTGSCHQLTINDNSAIIIDCGLFQGDEISGKSSQTALAIDFDINNIKALVVTHCHLDHVGRIPYLLAAGFDGPIYASRPSALLLPLVIEDAVKVGISRDEKLINGVLKRLAQQVVPLEYNQWHMLDISSSPSGWQQAKIRLQVAGHIMGSAYVECELSDYNITEKQKAQQPNAMTPATSKQGNKHRIVFSGDLGARYTPLLPAPKSPYRADTLIIESTYGDSLHHGRRQRRNQLENLLHTAVSDQGVVLIPAFSIGRTQELLYEIESIIYRHRRSPGSQWPQLDIIVDSPLAAKFTESYQALSQYWDNEAKRRLNAQRHPLDFAQLTTIDSHQDHLNVINYLASRKQAAIVIAASGMCTGGRIVNYLERFLPIATTDVIFVGYQAQGTAGREIIEYGPKGGWVLLNGNKIIINAKVHVLSGYSAHADQHDLIRFVMQMKIKPQHILIVHGDTAAKHTLKAALQSLLKDCHVEIAT